ncbi:MAG: hypothetical protein AAFX76_02645, partial [Planctomycetota bacterium]
MRTQTGAMDVVVRAWPADRVDTPVVVEVELTNSDAEPFRGEVRFGATDWLERPIAWSATRKVSVDGGGAETLKVAYDGPTGYVNLHVHHGEERLGSVDFAVVPPPHPGARPESFFASNTSRIHSEDERLDMFRSIGLRVMRTHFHPRVVTDDPDWGLKPLPTEPLELEWGPLDEGIARTDARGLTLMPVTAYALQGTTVERGSSGHTAKSEWAHKTGQHGPPRDFDEFIDVWRQVIERYPQLNTIEIYNEPWIWGWAWAASPAAYREFQVKMAEMIRETRSDMRIITGNSSMFVVDHIQPFPESYEGLLDGTTHHPYVLIDTSPTFRDLPQLRAIDSGFLVNRQMGLPFYYLTEGGTRYRIGPNNDIFNNRENARKVVQFQVLTAMAGGYQTNVQHQVGYGPDFMRGNVSYAVLSHLLEDRPMVADVWPELEMVHGAIFASPRFVDDAVRALPRADEIGARWQVPVPESRADDRTKVAVIWSFTGVEDRADEGGTLTFDDGEGLRAFDLMGREIARRADGSLAVPLGDDPVYVLTEALDVVAFRERVRAARAAGITPVDAYAVSLQRPADEAQPLRVRVQSQLNRGLTARVSADVALPNGEKLGLSAEEVELVPGQLADVVLEWPGGVGSAEGVYAVTLRVESTDELGHAFEPTVIPQLLQSARFAKRTVEVDGRLDDWAGLTPLVLDTQVLGTGQDFSQYVFNPMLDVPAAEDEPDRIVARVHTAYDDGFV